VGGKQENEKDYILLEFKRTSEEKNPWLLEKMFESRFPEASGREEG
jgi:hypothetical protein